MICNEDVAVYARVCAAANKSVVTVVLVPVETPF